MVSYFWIFLTLKTWWDSQKWKEKYEILRSEGTQLATGEGQSTNNIIAHVETTTLKQKACLEANVHIGESSSVQNTYAENMEFEEYESKKTLNCKTRNGKFKHWIICWEWTKMD